MQAETTIQIYDFENAIEAAFQKLLEAEGLSAFVSLDVDEVVEPEEGEPLDDKHQRPRPRVELYFATGQETGHYHPSHFRADAFTGNLMLRIVGSPKTTTREHSDYRAKVRDVMAGSRDEFKSDSDNNDANALLPYHSVMDVVESGTNPNYQDDDGSIESAITYQIKFNIRPDAWPA